MIGNSIPRWFGLNAEALAIPVLLGLVVGCTACTESPSPTAVEAIPMALEAVTPTSLTGTVGSEVSPAPTVRVKDQNGNPMRGVDVRFDLTAGGGAIANTSARTDEDGTATVGTWRLGPAAGSHTVTARSAGLRNLVFTATAVESDYGSVTGVVRGSGTGYPWGTGNPGERALGWPLLGIYAVIPGQPRRVIHEDGETGSFTFDSVPSGRWTIQFDGQHPWSAVFPGMPLYADTAITVTVVANQTVVVPDVVPRPVDPFIVVAIDHCPWGFSSPPTLEDWGSCDSGYWGAPVEVQVQVNGVVGTATSGRQYSLSISPGRWHFELHDVIAGDYDVSVALGAGSVAWRLVPWQSSTTPLHVDRGIAYALFSLWSER